MALLHVIMALVCTVYAQDDRTVYAQDNGTVYAQDGVEDQCVSNPCFNNGTCNTTENGTATCDCTTGYKGRFCGVEDHCVPNPCLKNGTCISAHNGTATCNCTFGYKGKYCGDQDCVDIGKDCERLVTVGTCRISGLLKRNCLKSCRLCGVCQSAECTANKFCKENTSMHGQYECVCLEGLTGTNCDESLCNPPCKNGAICKNETSCLCPPGFNGITCDNCTDEDTQCQQRADAGECETNSTLMGSYCRLSCHNCPPQPCTMKGEYCARHAFCNEAECQCEPKRKGDPRIECVRKDKEICILGHELQLQSFSGSTTNFNFPCKYRLSKVITPLRNKAISDSYCSIEVYGYSLISAKGNNYPVAAEINFTMVTIVNNTLEQINTTNFVLYTRTTDYSKGKSFDTCDLGEHPSWNGVGVLCDFDKIHQFDVLFIPQCDFRLLFRRYNEDEDDKGRTQSRLPGITISVGKTVNDSVFGNAKMFGYPASLCGAAGSTDNGQLYKDRAKFLGFKEKEVSKALLHDALAQNLTQRSGITGVEDAVFQDRDSCQTSVEHFSSCGTVKAQAVKKCHAFLESDDLLGCLTPTATAIQAFSYCMGIKCNVQTSSRERIEDLFIADTKCQKRLKEII